MLLWPNGFFLGSYFEWRVPVDDENTLSISWIYTAVPEERRPYRQEVIPSWQSPIKDPETGRWITTHVINQDIIGWVGQSDKGIVMMRNRFFKELEAVVEGRASSAIRRSTTRSPWPWRTASPSARTPCPANSFCMPVSRTMCAACAKKRWGMRSTRAGSEPEFGCYQRAVRLTDRSFRGRSA
ncbi:hypothetical protein HHL26_17805 [Sphingobium sp. TB-6]|uniref:hypothetical protein n=1 Tax=Sphingobium sp. TB-6 TaxID=2728850 RepID=UPI001469BF89|nr:hypothetical protein [Sphingobium sp. TB-6]NML90901.1 hypothetical protein [Sphingobium sp. TB-6]